MISGIKITTPSNEPIVKGTTYSLTIKLRSIRARLAFEKNCVIPWSGITTLGGNICSIIANRRIPPPKPAHAVNSELQKAMIAR